MAIQVGMVVPLIQVYDMPTALAFYRDKLGFDRVQDSGRGDDIDWCLLTLGEAWLMLNTAYESHERPDAPDPARIAAHRDTGLFFDAQDLDAIYDHLRAQGIACEPPKTVDYGMRQLYVRDPDGYELCFQHPA
ncbi:MAG TPA: VOC family protein [Caulobacter sp.]|nr:VOC family protein [Caulobacter sp.]